MVSDIVVEKYDVNKLEELEITSWPIWEKEVSSFSWSYDKCETCYIIKGEAIVLPENGDPISFKAGDKVVFPEGLICVWKILSPIKKYYKFG